MHHLNALSQGVRGERARFKARLQSGEIGLSEALREHTEAEGDLSIAVVLQSIRRMGPRKSVRLLGLAEVRPTRRLGNLNAGERERLLAAFARCCPRLSRRAK